MLQRLLLEGGGRTSVGLDPSLFLQSPKGVSAASVGLWPVVCPSWALEHLCCQPLEMETQSRCDSCALGHEDILCWPLTTLVLLSAHEVAVVTLLRVEMQAAALQSQLFLLLLPEAVPQGCVLPRSHSSLFSLFPACFREVQLQDPPSRGHLRALQTLFFISSVDRHSGHIPELLQFDAP